MRHACVYLSWCQDPARHTTVTIETNSWRVEYTKSSIMNPIPAFDGFGEWISAARRAGEKAIITDTMKLLCNSGYRKTVTNVDRHRDVKYCTEICTSTLINNKRFRQLDVVDEQECREVPTATSHRLLSLPVRQTTHAIVLLRLCRPICRTIAVSVGQAGESIDGLVRADRRAHYFRHRSQWLPAECSDEHEDDYVRARIAGRPWMATDSCCFARKAFDKWAATFEATPTCFPPPVNKRRTKGTSCRAMTLAKATPSSASI